jgi:hypothetical protein
VAPMAVGATLEGCGGHALSLKVVAEWQCMSMFSM